MNQNFLIPLMILLKLYFKSNNKKEFLDFYNIQSLNFDSKSNCLIKSIKNKLFIMFKGTIIGKLKTIFKED